jgi:hypothetical protein
MLFIIFDIESIFLYPFAVAFDSLGLFALVEMVLFILTRLHRLRLRVEARRVRVGLMTTARMPSAPLFVHPTSPTAHPKEG